MSEILEKIRICIERGKINAGSPYPPDLKGEPGADEYTKMAVDEGINPEDILSDALVPGMRAIGEKFASGEAFIPDLLMSAKSMNASMEHLAPFYESGAVKPKGVFIVGTVQGDLHDIGKNLVAMVIKGGGWEVVDLGVDVSPEKFLKAVEEHPGATVGLSALLTTTMPNMERIVSEIKSGSPETRVIIGGAPINAGYAEKIGADAYFADPQGAVGFLNSAA